MMHHYSPSPRWLAVPGIGFPQNQPDSEEQQHHENGTAKHNAKGQKSEKPATKLA